MIVTLRGSGGMAERFSCMFITVANNVYKYF